jgi:hypothetical protein
MITLIELHIANTNEPVWINPYDISSIESVLASKYGMKQDYTEIYCGADCCYQVKETFTQIKTALGATIISCEEPKLPVFNKKSKVPKNRKLPKHKKFQKPVDKK